MLVEITDDMLVDFHRDPLIQYWDDDCLEIFIDENFSGGDHQYNHNAFAYHIALDNQAVDIGTDKAARLYNHHLTSTWRQQDNKLYWEVAIDIYDDTYEDDSTDNTPVALATGKVLGFMLAYCDNDGSDEREHFVGSHDIEPVDGDKNLGYIDASVFGAVTLAPQGE